MLLPILITIETVSVVIPTNLNPEGLSVQLSKFNSENLK